MLQAICPDVWGFESDVQIPIGTMPARMTVLRSADGSLVIHSPLALTDRTESELRELGEVRAIVAPSCFHYKFLRAAGERFPAARLMGPSRLNEKLPGVHFETLPTTGVVDALGPDLLVRRIDGAPGIDEHVFFHRPSRTLVVTDLLFNLHRCRSVAMKVLLYLGGTWNRPAQSIAWRFLVKDRAAAARSFDEILSWQFDRVAPAHGDVLEDGARAPLEAALGWVAPRERALTR